jgi:hypothetical protein
MAEAMTDKQERLLRAVGRAAVNFHKSGEGYGGQGGPATEALHEACVRYLAEEGRQKRQKKKARGRP